MMDAKYFIPLLIAGTILFIIFLFFIVVYIIIYKRRQDQNELDKERMIFDHQKHMLNARLDEQERAMNQISKEIHDNVSQKIDFLNMNVKALKESLPESANSRFFENSQQLLEDVTNDLRNISYSLNSDYIQARGLGEILSRELNYISVSKKIDCNIHVEGIYRPLPPDKELLIYRIAQEALHNTIKYAGASSIDIILHYEDAKFRIEIADNGKGFDAHLPEQMNGLGFRNMQQRAELLGGKLNIVASPGNGCRISLEVAS